MIDNSIYTNSQCPSTKCLTAALASATVPVTPEYPAACSLSFGEALLTDGSASFTSLFAWKCWMARRHTIIVRGRFASRITGRCWILIDMHIAIPTNTNITLIYLITVTCSIWHVHDEMMLRIKCFLYEEYTHHHHPAENKSPYNYSPPPQDSHTGNQSGLSEKGTD